MGFGILTNVAARERVRERETNEPEGSERRAILENDTEKRERKKKSDSERANNRLIFGEISWKGLNKRV